MGSEEAVFLMPALRENRSGDRIREPNVLLLGMTVTGSGDGLEVESLLKLHYSGVWESCSGSESESGSGGLLYLANNVSSSSRRSLGF